MVSFALDPELIAELEAWLVRQEFPPTKTAVIEAALRAFLKSRGHGVMLTRPDKPNN